MAIKAQNGDIKFKEGYIRTFGEIPLPDGLEEKNCIWWVSLTFQEVDDDDTPTVIASTPEVVKDIRDNFGNNGWGFRPSVSTKYHNTFPRGRTVLCMTYQRYTEGLCHYVIVGSKSWDFS